MVIAGATSGSGLWALAYISKENIGMKKDSTKVNHKIGTRKEWLEARLDLLKLEKEHTRRGDELAQKRQELPVGSGRQRVSIRDRRRDSLAIGPLSRAFATPRLPLHVWTRLHRRLPVLLGDCRRVQRLPDSLSQS